VQSTGDRPDGYRQTETEPSSHAIQKPTAQQEHRCITDHKGGRDQSVCLVADVQFFADRWRNDRQDLPVKKT